MKKIVISSWLYEKVNKVDPGNVKLIKNYVELDKYYMTNTLQNRDMVVSLISHPNPYKGTEDAIEALSLVKKRIPELKVIMFGTHPRNASLPDYFVYYQMADENILRDMVYNKSAVYLLPSVVEGWGLTATESMACGCALVSTRNGGVEDFGINNYSALLCNVHDINGMASKVIELLENPRQRVELATNGLKMVNSMHFIKSAMLFEQVLLEMSELSNNEREN